MKIFKNIDEKPLPQNDLVSHLEHKAKVIPFPREVMTQDKRLGGNYMRRRVMAFCVDLYAILLIKVMMTVAYTQFFKSFFFQLPSYKQKQMLSGLEVIDISTTPILFFTYFMLSYFSGEGKTLGKLAFKLTVVRADLKNDYFPNLKEAFMRTIAYLACYMSLGTLFILPFIRKDKKSLADLFSKTVVFSDHELYDALKSGEQLNQVITLTLVPTPEEAYKAPVDQSEDSDQTKKAA